MMCGGVALLMDECHAVAAVADAERPWIAGNDDGSRFDIPISTLAVRQDRLVRVARRRGFGHGSRERPGAHAGEALRPNPG